MSDRPKRRWQFRLSSLMTIALVCSFAAIWHRQQSQIQQYAKDLQQARADLHMRQLELEFERVKYERDEALAEWKFADEMGNEPKLAVARKKYFRSRSDLQAVLTRMYDFENRLRVNQGIIPKYTLSKD